MVARKDPENPSNDTAWALLFVATPAVNWGHPPCTCTQVQVSHRKIGKFPARLAHCWPARLCRSSSVETSRWSPSSWRMAYGCAPLVALWWRRSSPRSRRRIGSSISSLSLEILQMRVKQPRKSPNTRHLTDPWKSMFPRDVLLVLSSRSVARRSDRADTGGGRDQKRRCVQGTVRARTERTSFIDASEKHDSFLIVLDVAGSFHGRSQGQQLIGQTCKCPWRDKFPRDSHETQSWRRRSCICKHILTVRQRLDLLQQGGRTHHHTRPLVLVNEFFMLSGQTNKLLDVAVKLGSMFATTNVLESPTESHCSAVILNDTACGSGSNWLDDRSLARVAVSSAQVMTRLTGGKHDQRSSPNHQLIRKSIGFRTTTRLMDSHLTDECSRQSSPDRRTTDCFSI